MKTIFLLITIIILSVSCKKKKSVEPAPEPIKTTKSFKVTLKYVQDSVGSYYLSQTHPPAYIGFFVSFKSPNDPTFNSPEDYLYAKPARGYVGFTSTITHTDKLEATVDINQPLTYYITLTLGLSSVDGLHDRYNTTIKQYTFTEGDNGTIDFKLIP